MAEYLTPDEKAEVDRAMASLMQISDEWWRTAGTEWQAPIASMCSMIPGPFKERFYDWFSAAMRQAHTEGLYEGFNAGKDFMLRLPDQSSNP